LVRVGGTAGVFCGAITDGFGAVLSMISTEIDGAMRGANFKGGVDESKSKINPWRTTVIKTAPE